MDTTRELRLVDLTSPGLAHIGADERLCSGEHDISQQWSLPLWGHPATVDGLYYRARHDPSRISVALFDRAATAVSLVSVRELLDGRHRAMLGAILDTCQFALMGPHEHPCARPLSEGRARAGSSTWESMGR